MIAEYCYGLEIELKQLLMNSQSDIYFIERALIRVFQDLRQQILNAGMPADEFEFTCLKAPRTTYSQRFMIVATPTDRLKKMKAFW